MALIDCPECGAKISERAPTCPQCGFPIATESSDLSTASAEPMAEAKDADPTPAAASATEPAPLPTERSAEPFSLAGRPLPIAFLLFWGGMVLGVVLKFAVFGGDQVPKPFSYIPYLMVFGGVLWFSVTEFTMLIRNRKRR